MLPPSPIRPAIDALHNFGRAARNSYAPVLRIGVTGLARAGKTVFTTALVHHLMAQGDLPALRASGEGRLRRARLVPQPDDAVARFAYEDHLDRLTQARQWPESTSRISQLRLAIDYERGAGRWLRGPAHLALDIVDYPGEWLLDLILMDESFADWSREVVAQARQPERAAIAGSFLAQVDALDSAAPADEQRIARLSEVFKAYLQALRQGPEAIATTPPGRFLMPGDLAGSPALTFAPLILPENTAPARGSIGALMQRRYEAYKQHVVVPFFRDHFRNLDRQIVLVDVLSALDGGREAVTELEYALDRVLLAMRAGRNSWLTRLFAPRTERLLFAATKADHLHQTQHRRLEAILRHLVERAIRRMNAAGGEVGAVAIAALRTTQETTVRDGADILRAVAGTPEAGERIGETVFDGVSEAAVFPGDLPEDPASVFADEKHGGIAPGSLRFPRFRPPAAPGHLPGRKPHLPHIRLDRALEFLIGDHLR